MANAAKIAIIYYSSTGHAWQVARAFEEGVRAAGAEVRLRKVREVAPPEAMAQRPDWRAHLEATEQVPEATLADLEWANGYVFGSPTRYGVVSAQLKQFIDQAGPLWMQGKLANKPVTAFAGAMNAHGGQENTILSIYSIMHHWGAVILPTGYTDQSIYAAGGNPYGVSYSAPQGSPSVAEEVLAAARFQGARLARYAAVIAENQAYLLSGKETAHRKAA
jgi:NAD(P)H dehydrogenase (quinone)